MFRKNISFLLLSFALGATAHAAGSSLDEAIGEVAHHWAKANYSTPEKEKSAAFEKLSVEADQLRLAYPGKAEPMIWEAIVLASAAKADGGLGALGKVKQARELLLNAEKIDPTALNGSVYNSLGSLYAKVPGWPIAFGDKDKARLYLEKALSINPKGIDPNYFYGDLLADQGEYAKAVEYLKRALEAPARPGREDADAGRRADINRLLQSIIQKHGDQLASK
jgi:tetratricopeptide (TPR) repeat protein